MKKIIFVIGGCRSGKSSHALELAEAINRENRCFLATCIPRDDEMRLRVKNHIEDRGTDWQTVEAPLLLPEAIIEHSPKAGVILADCLTLWLSNLLMETDDQAQIFEKAQSLLQALETAGCPVILVSNEVGTGVVPENKLARQFRDLAGFVNQKVAAHADRVIWMVAGIPVVIKEKDL